MLRYIDSAVDSNDNELLTIDGRDMYEEMRRQTEQDTQEVLPSTKGVQYPQDSAPAGSFGDGVEPTQLPMMKQKFMQSPEGGIADLQGTLGTEIAQTADLGQWYRNADRALGGWLPSGGTANPLSDAVRPVLDALPTAEIDPSLNNYYRENRETAKKQGQAAQQESQKLQDDLNRRAENAGYAASADGSLDVDAAISVYQGEEGQRTFNQIKELETRARRHGIGESGDLLLPDASNREAVLDNRANANLSGDEIDRLGGIDDVELRAGIRERILNPPPSKPEPERLKNAKRGANLAETIDNSYDLDTRDGPSNGSLGCVYGVNKVIEASGLEVPWKDPASGANSVYIPFVENWIITNGGSVVSNEEAKPGDIVSDGGHMGILTDKVDEEGNKIVLSNSSSRASMSYEYPLIEGQGNKVYRVPQLQN